MEKHVKFFLHEEWATMGGRRMDLAVVKNGKIVRVFTIGVDGGNTVGALNRPFEVGAGVGSAFAAVLFWNEIPDGAVCKCGAADSYHIQSAACTDHSSIREVGPRGVLVLAVKAKRTEVAAGILALLRTLEHDGEIELKV